jgi:hypothetical protein
LITSETAVGLRGDCSPPARGNVVGRLFNEIVGLLMRGDFSAQLVVAASLGEKCCAVPGSRSIAA